MPTTGADNRSKQSLVLKRGVARQAADHYRSLARYGRRQDRWERQADEAAAMVLRGEQGVARRLSPVRAASYSLPSSLGGPLPDGLRTELEEGFGADLRAVRIHSNAYAAAAARRENARAFAAGRDIYFGQGAYQPGSEPGKALLAHEVAHVLQQTGRRGRSGRLQVADIRGAGQIQLALNAEEYVKKFNLAFSNLTQAHQVNQDPELRQYAEQLQQAISTADGSSPDLLSPDTARALRDFVNKEGFPNSELQLAFLYDCLKLTGNEPLALKLIHRYPDAKTRFWMEEMGHSVRDAFILGTANFDLQYLRRIFQMENRLEAMWGLFIDTFRQMVFAPDRSIQAVNVENIGTFRQLSNRLEGDALFSGPPANSEALNEVAWGTSEFLLGFDESRLELVRSWMEQFSHYYGPTPSRSYYLAHHIRRWSEGLIGAPVDIVAHLGERIYEICDRAVRFWGQVLTISTEAGGFTFKPLTEAELAEEKNMALLGQHPHFTEAFPAELLKAAQQLFKLGAGREFPNHKRYALQVDRALGTVRDFSDKLQLTLVDLMRKETVDEPLVRAYGFVIVWLEIFEKQLNGFDRAADLDFEKTHQLNDVRFAHRVRTALFLNTWVDRFMKSGLDAGKKDKSGKTAFQKLWEYLQTIVEHKDQGKSQAALLGEWKRDTESTINQLKEDFPQGIEELDPLSIHQVTQLYLALYYSELDRKINKLLKDEKSEDLSDPFKALKKEPILVRAQRKSSRPKRWIIKDTAFAISAEDREAWPTVEEQNELLARLVRQHPKSEKAVNDELSKDPSLFHLFPKKYHSQQGKALDPYFWIIPTPDKLVNFLREGGKDNKLNVLVGAFHDLTLPEVEALSPPDWLTALSDSGILFIGGEPIDLMKEISHRAGAVLESKKKSLEKTLRKLGSHERRLLSRRIIAVLSKYDRHSNDAEIYQIPGLVLRALEQFHLSVFPEKDRLPQQAALILSIASALNQGLGEQQESFLVFFTVTQGAVERFELLNGYIGHLLLAKKYAKAAHRPELDAVLNDQEKSMVDTQLDELDKLLKAMLARRREQQTRFGFQAQKSTQTLKSFNFASKIQAGEGKTFTIDGNKITILKIYHDFEYIPSWGRKTAAAGPTAGESGYSASILKVNGEERPVERRKGQSLFQIKFNEGNPFNVKDDNDDLLREVNYLLAQQAFVLGLENTAAIIEAWAELMLDLGEFIPGVGQGIMAARIVASVLEFLNSDEFDAIKGLLTGDVTELIDAMKDKLSETFTPEGMIDLLLFGHPMLTTLAELGSGGTSKNSGRISARTKKSKIGQVFRALMGLGKGVSQALGNLQEHVQLPVKGMQTFLAVRPGLSGMIDLVIRHAHLLEKIDKAPDIPDLGEVKARLEDSAHEFGGQLANIFQAIRKMELPKEIVPLALVTRLIVDLILDRMPRKVRLVKKAIFVVLDATGASDTIFEEVAHSIKGTGVDPNKYWQDFTKEYIDDKMHAAVQEIMDDLINMLNTLSDGAFGELVPIEKGESATADSFEDPELKMPEMEAYRKAPPQDDEPPENMEIPRGGRPLPKGIREKAERDFGHDFSHVRILAGGEARDFTAFFGAEGLTTGSFIFLRSGYQMDAAGAGSVLYHELAHVLQQTGPRPKEKQHPNIPVLGKPDKGLSYDKASEQSADAMARHAHDREETEPLEIETSRTVGLNPIPAQGLRKLLRKLNRFEGVVEFVEVIEQQKIGEVPKTSLRFKYAELIWEGLQSFMRAGINAGDFPYFMRKGDAYLQVISYFTNNVAKGTEKISENLLRKIAAAALVEKIEKKGGKKVKTIEFHPNRFLRGLEAVLLLKAGIGMTLSIKGIYKAKMEAGQRVNIAGDKAEVFHKAKVKGLYLPAIGGTAQLWKDSMRSFGADASKFQQNVRSTLKPLGLANNFSGTDERNEITKITILKVDGAGKFLFTQEFTEYIKRLETTSKDAPEDVPPVKEYVDVDQSPVLPGTVGLRIGTYGDHPGPHKDRQSHHITQFLLIEYFSNAINPPLQPFRQTASGRRYPGLTIKSGKPTEFSSPGHTVNFEMLNQGTRGDRMPAILLSTRTHQKGNLHIRPTTTDDSDRQNRQATQGNNLDNVYRAKFKSALESTGFKQVDDYLNKEKKEAQPTRFNTYIGMLSKSEKDKLTTSRYDAIQETYQWMRNKMMPALEDALVNHELPYYEKIAFLKPERRKSDTELKEAYKATASHMDKVFTVARSRNDQVMGSHGWTS